SRPTSSTWGLDDEPRRARRAGPVTATGATLRRNRRVVRRPCRARTRALAARPGAAGGARSVVLGRRRALAPRSHRGDGGVRAPAHRGPRWRRLPAGAHGPCAGGPPPAPPAPAP